MRRFLPLAIAVLLAACGSGNAPQAAPTPAQTAASNQSESQRAYAAANARMHQGMAQIDADPDVAFAQGMIPHHEGAVAMAQVELRHGKNPELRALAEKVIAAQEPEIAQLRAWLKRRGSDVPATTSGTPHAGR